MGILICGVWSDLIGVQTPDLSHIISFNYCIFDCFIGDEVVEYNGRCLQKATFEEVQDVIMDTKQDPQVELIVHRNVRYSRDILELIVHRTDDDNDDDDNDRYSIL